MQFHWKCCIIFRWWEKGAVWWFEQGGLTKYVHMLVFYFASCKGYPLEKLLQVPNITLQGQFPWHNIRFQKWNISSVQEDKRKIVVWTYFFKPPSSNYEASPVFHKLKIMQLFQWSCICIHQVRTPRNL